MTRPVTLESSRSKHTGHDGSSYRLSLSTSGSSFARADARELYTLGGNAGTGTGTGVEALDEEDERESSLCKTR